MSVRHAAKFLADSGYASPEIKQVYVREILEAHDALVAALRDANAYTEHGPEDSITMLRKQLNQVSRVCRAALAAAEAKWPRSCSSSPYCADRRARAAAEAKS